MDDGEQTAATTNDREEQSTIYHFLFLVEVAGFTVVLASCSSVRSFPRNRSRKFRLSNDEKRIFITTKQANRPKSGLTMTINTGRLDKAIHNLLKYGATSDHEGQEYASLIVVSALEEE